MVIVLKYSNSSNSHFLFYIKVFLQLLVAYCPYRQNGHGKDKMKMEKCVIERF
jgi:hypothetical protein